MGLKMTNEIDEIPAGFMEVPVNGPIEPKKFGSGQDWLINDFVAEREALITRAKDGSFSAKQALRAEPHNIKRLVLSGQEII